MGCVTILRPRSLPQAPGPLFARRCPFLRGKVLPIHRADAVFAPSFARVGLQMVLHGID